MNYGAAVQNVYAPAAGNSEIIPHAIHVRHQRTCPHICMQLQQQLSSLAPRESEKLSGSNIR